MLILGITVVIFEFRKELDRKLRKLSDFVGLLKLSSVKITFSQKSRVKVY